MWYTYSSRGFIPVEKPKEIYIENNGYEFEKISDLANGGIYSSEAL
jgi:hypothetical protein